MLQLKKTREVSLRLRCGSEKSPETARKRIKSEIRVATRRGPEKGTRGSEDGAATHHGFDARCPQGTRSFALGSVAICTNSALI